MQLSALEDLFTRTSHPTQPERDLLARAINMYVFPPFVPIHPLASLLLFQYFLARSAVVLFFLPDSMMLTARNGSLGR